MVIDAVTMIIKIAKIVDRMRRGILIAINYKTEKKVNIN